MYKVGDYVVYETNLIHELAEVINDRGDKCHVRLIRDGKLLWIDGKYIRPAVLADWANEIPEKYKSWLGSEYSTTIIVKWCDDCYQFVYFDSSKISHVMYERLWIEADTMSQLLSIPIMPYEQYKKYMEGK